MRRPFCIAIMQVSWHQSHRSYQGFLLVSYPLVIPDGGGLYRETCKGLRVARQTGRARVEYHVIALKLRHASEESELFRLLQRNTSKMMMKKNGIHDRTGEVRQMHPVCLASASLADSLSVCLRGSDQIQVDLKPWISLEI